jgi:hypothetical protein
MQLNVEGSQAKRIALVVSLREAARLLDCSYWTLVQWARLKPPKIKTVLLGGRLRKVPMSEVERLARGGDGQ